jgi:hypothetical protein
MNFSFISFLTDLTHHDLEKTNNKRINHTLPAYKSERFVDRSIVRACMPRRVDGKIDPTPSPAAGVCGCVGVVCVYLFRGLLLRFRRDSNPSLAALCVC